VPAQVEDSVMRALARNPAYRPPSVAAFADELGGRRVAAPTVPHPAPASRRRLWLVLAAVLALSAVAVGIALATGGGGSSTPTVPPRRATVRPIAPGADAQEQARNIAAWLRARARR
jgi:hypothetical protein